MDEYAAVHVTPKGPGDSRPTALQIVKNADVEGKWRGKVILVTGCSSGLGIETVRALAATGAAIYGTARDISKAEKALGKELLEGGRVAILRLDLGSLASVRACAAEFLAMTKSKLNVLIANAGVMATPTASKTEDGFDEQFGTNHLGHFLLFNLLKPALLASATPDFNSRVVVLSSSAHRFAEVDFDDPHFEAREYDPRAAYSQSKTANIYFASEIERRYGSKGLHAVSVHPGSISTGIARHMDPSVMAALDENQDRQKIKKTVEQGAATTVWAAVAPAWEGKGGKYLNDCQVAQPVGENNRVFDPGHAAHAYDQEKEARLWAVSLDMVGLKDDVEKS